MTTALYSKAGAIFLGAAIFGIGTIHIVIGSFPSGFLPVPPSLMGKTILAYLDGLAMICAGALIVTGKFQKAGAIMAVAIFSVLLLILHLPNLVAHIHDANEWTGTFEVASILGGALVLTGSILTHEAKQSNKDSWHILIALGRYFLAISFFVFGILHFEFEKYIETLIPTWLPFTAFWSYLVMISFFALFVSFVTNKFVLLSSYLAFLMYGIWLLILHGPLVATHLDVEPQWTSFFVALAMCGIGLLVYSSVKESLNKFGTIGVLNSETQNIK